MTSPSDLSSFYKNLLAQGSFRGADDECDFFINNLTNSVPFAFSRFNDGEMLGICSDPGVTVARGDQKISPQLKSALIASMGSSQHNYFVGVTCPHCIKPVFHKVGMKIASSSRFVVRAVATTNRNWAKVIVAMKNACALQKIRFISGDDQDLSFLRNEMGLNIIEHVKIPKQDSWASVQELEPHIRNIEDGDIVMLSLGPTARVLAQRWFKERPGATFLDVGSNFDPFTRNVWHRCHLGWEKGFNVQYKCKGCN